MVNLAGWMINASQKLPVVMAIKDLQWVDASTLELINTLLERYGIPDGALHRAAGVQSTMAYPRAS